MNRPLETTFWMRFSRFIKGVFLYNTIYWKRASDDLDIRHMSREERASLRPKRNLELIRPRGNPRPTAGGPVLSLPSDVSEPVTQPGVAAEPPHQPAAGEGETEVGIHRRKKRRRSRHSKVIPKQYYDSAYEGSGGIFRWLFKK